MHFMEAMDAARCLADVEVADFVALQLVADRSGAAPAEAVAQAAAAAGGGHYQNIAAGVREELPTRIGLCCGVHRGDGWELRAHELGLWPGDCLGAMGEELSAKRRCLAGVSPAAHAGSRAPAWGASNRWAGQLTSSVRWVIAALQERGTPLVVHNGLQELPRLFDKFIGDLPERSQDFASAWVARIPVVFDTSFMALTSTPDGSTRSETPPPLAERLAALGAELARRPEAEVAGRFKETGLFVYRASSQHRGLVGGEGYGSAARDAMTVAESFLLRLADLLSAEATAVSVPAVARPAASGIANELSTSASVQRGVKRGASDAFYASDARDGLLTPRPRQRSATRWNSDARSPSPVPAKVRRTAAASAAARVVDAEPDTVAKGAPPSTTKVSIVPKALEALRKRQRHIVDVAPGSQTRKALAVDDAIARDRVVTKLSSLLVENFSDASARERCRRLCRRLCNRVSVLGTRVGAAAGVGAVLQLDVCELKRLATELRKNRGEAGRLAQAMSAQPPQKEVTSSACACAGGA